MEEVDSRQLKAECQRGDATESQSAQRQKLGSEEMLKRRWEDEDCRAEKSSRKPAEAWTTIAEFAGSSCRLWTVNCWLLSARGTSGDLGHTRPSRYRCSLPGLAGFAGPRCTEPEVPRSGSPAMQDCWQNC